MFCSHTSTAFWCVTGSTSGHISYSTQRYLPGCRLLHRSCGNLWTRRWFHSVESLSAQVHKATFHMGTVSCNQDRRDHAEHTTGCNDWMLECDAEGLHMRSAKHTLASTRYQCQCSPVAALVVLENGVHGLCIHVVRAQAAIAFANGEVHLQVVVLTRACSQGNRVGCVSTVYHQLVSLQKHTYNQTGVC